MAEQIDNVTNDLAQVAADARSTFSALTPAQLNWKPSEKEWSVAQCFDHLIVTHSLYFPLFERFAAGDTKMSFWEKASPFSGFFGRFLIKGLDPKNLKKMKTTGKAQPSASEIGGDIIERFCEHQQQMIDAINKLPSDLDASKQIITSPLLGAITYSLADAFTFVPMHCRRHFDQAKRVTEAERFPA
jgi:hypothetical protein